MFQISCIYFNKYKQKWNDLLVHNNYWYNIDVNIDEQPGDGIIPLNIPLLLLLNVKYLISHTYNPDLEKISNLISLSKSETKKIFKLLLKQKLIIEL